MALRELIVEAWLTQAPKRLVKEFLDDAGDVEAIPSSQHISLE